MKQYGVCIETKGFLRGRTIVYGPGNYEEVDEIYRAIIRRLREGNGWLVMSNESIPENEIKRIYICRYPYELEGF